jgi:hypothetical protein
VPAYGSAYFSTQTVSGYNTTNLYYNDILVDAKASDGIACPTPTPTPTITPTFTPTYTATATATPLPQYLLFGALQGFNGRPLGTIDRQLLSSVTLVIRPLSDKKAPTMRVQVDDPYEYSIPLNMGQYMVSLDGGNKVIVTSRPLRVSFRLLRDTEVNFAVRPKRKRLTSAAKLSAKR